MNALAASSVPVWTSIVSTIAAVAGVLVALFVFYSARSYRQLLIDIQDLLESASAHTTAAVIRGIRELFDRRGLSRRGGRRAYDEDEED